MKATITIKPSKGGTFALVRYCVSPKPEHAAAVGIAQATDERLLDSFGIGCEIGDPAELANELEQRTKQLLSKKGKMHRHVVFSVVGERNQAEAVEALKQLGKDWQREFCPKSKVAFFIHGDGSKLHMHAIVESYDARNYKRHDWSAADVSKMQDMEYTNEVNPGKGNKLSKTEKEKYEGNQTDRAEKIDQCKRERRSKDTELAEDLVKWVRSTGVKPESESGLLLLLQHNMPDGWSLNDKTRRGKPKKQPSITNGTTTVRLQRFWKWVEKKKASVKDKEKKCGNCGKPTRQCSCIDR